eukprot:365293-Chlamydomonas_euryale.AAC.1
MKEGKVCRRYRASRRTSRHIGRVLRLDCWVAECVLGHEAGQGVQALTCFQKDDPTYGVRPAVGLLGCRRFCWVMKEGKVCRH